MNRNDIITAWLQGKTMAIKSNGNKTLHTNGQELYSYAQCVGITTHSGEKVAVDKRKMFSPTTSRHVSLAMQAANLTVDPDQIYTQLNKNKNTWAYRK